MKRCLWLGSLLVFVFALGACTPAAAPATPTLPPPTPVPPTVDITRTLIPAPTSWITPTPACETHTASTEISASSTEVAVGDTVTVTVTLHNEGCAKLGLLKYTLSMQPEGDAALFEPANPPPVEHSLAIANGESDTAQFELTAVASGKATISASVSFEVHLGYPGPAYWAGSGNGPLAITVRP